MPVMNQPFSGTHPGWHVLVEAGIEASRIDAVLGFYDEPHRVYHDRRHIEALLNAAEQLGCRLTVTQALALLFHDAIYVPGAPRGANENMSSQLLRAYSRGIDAATVSAACAIVVDTTDHIPTSAAACLVLDLDLVSLASPLEEFDLHTREIFFEDRATIAAEDDDAAWSIYTARTTRFFLGLLQRPHIYATPLFIERFEVAARQNLRASLDAFRRAERVKTR